MDRLTLTRIVKERQLPLLLSATKQLVTPMYRAAFLAAAARSGVLARLAVRPCDLQTLAHGLGVDEHAEELRTWLDIGVRLGDLAWFDDAYRLRSRTAKALARPGREPVSAALEEVLRFHLPVLLQAPQMLQDGRRLSLSDQDGQVIARSTRVVEPFVAEAVRRTLERDRPLRLLEVGCGNGTYVRLAAELNPRLTALAIDLQEEVAAEAAENMAVWGLAGRVQTRRADLRTLAVEPQFDLVTLHNNIYYFPIEDRISVLRKARSLLAPGGRLLLTTACRGGNLGLEVLNLWFTHADFGGPLPTIEDLVQQLTDAGFAQVTTRRLIPGDQFHAVVGVNAPAGQP
ncbi:MAG: methyltransferase domain-containing protein [Catenulispora sp.]|nr:methyltransferase domain-containing protein [Catenulispora sp.]